MQQFTTYGAKIHMDSAKPVQAMIRIYRNAVSFLIRVCRDCADQNTAGPADVR